MGRKRDLDEKSSQRKTKKIKLDNSQKPTVQADDVDFPRGGGTTFTPLEVKTIRAEAVKEADNELYEVCKFACVQYPVIFNYGAIANTICSKGVKEA